MHVEKIDMTVNLVALLLPMAGILAAIFLVVALVRRRRP
jgi:hypothetical protein